MSLDDAIYSKVIWDDKGLPHSEQFDDKYFCAQNGMCESEYVFCEGNDLKQRWEQFDGTSAFVIAETGFGSGLNFLCAWRLFDQVASENCKLHYISIDQFPLCPEDLQKALELWPDLRGYSKELVRTYSPQRGSAQTMEFQEGRVTLTILFDHVLVALDQIKGMCVDAWFLDGFAPSKNPEMWSMEVFVKMRALSRKRSTFSTFTVAGDVRRGLIEVGFEISKIKGYGSKRHMLVGSYRGET